MKLTYDIDFSSTGPVQGSLLHRSYNTVNYLNMTVSVLPAHQYEHCQQLTKQFKKLLNPVDKMKTEHISHSLQMNLYYVDWTSEMLTTKIYLKIPCKKKKNVQEKYIHNNMKHVNVAYAISDTIEPGIIELKDWRHFVMFYTHIFCISQSLCPRIARDSKHYGFIN